MGFRYENPLGKMRTGRKEEHLHALHSLPGPIIPYEPLWKRVALAPRVLFFSEFVRQCTRNLIKVLTVAKEDGRLLFIIKIILTITTTIAIIK